ncbi:MAG TPA: hypothetical protein VFU15_13625, partial [Bacteroidia bacterium]|nr:hypothetical protein [Bacteroidia bacterium]
DHDHSRIEIYSDIADSYWILKKYDQSAINYKKRIDAAPDKATISNWNAYGMALFLNKDYAAADSAFTKITIMDPQNPAGWFRRGQANAYMDKDMKSDSARIFYEKFYDLAITDKDKNKKDLVKACKYLAGYQYVQKNYACSKAYWQMILTLEPTDNDAKKQLDDPQLKNAATVDVGTCKKGGK